MIKSFNEKLQLVLKYPEMIEAIYDVLQAGIDKGYGEDDWLQPDGKTMSRKMNFDSKMHHAAKHFSGELKDESGLLHEAHEGTRALMGVTRTKRGLVHPDDIKSIPVIDSRLKPINEYQKGDEFRSKSVKVQHQHTESWVCKNDRCRCQTTKESSESKNDDL